MFKKPDAYKSTNSSEFILIKNLESITVLLGSQIKK